MAEQTVNGRRTDVPIQTKPLDPPEQAEPPPTLVADLPQVTGSAREEPPPFHDQDGEEQQERARFRRIRVVVQHRSSRAVARQVLYISTGAAVARRNRRDVVTTARHERMMRGAEAAGNHEVALLWEQRASHHRAERHRRRMELLRHAPAHIARGVIVGAALVTATLLVLGVILAASKHDAAQLGRPLRDAATFIAAMSDVITVLWRPALLLAAVGAVAWLWRTGREHAHTSRTGWAAALLPADTHASLIVTADAIVQALQHLGMPALNTAFKNNWLPKFVTTPVKEGQGYRAVFELPLGITPAMIADKRDLFARNLHRAPIEVWVTDAVQAGTGSAGVVDLWVADPGVLNKPAPEFPLLFEGAADVFAGVPGGVSPRGEAILVPIVGNNAVVGGMMGQGKSNTCRVVMLGCALDPIAQQWVFVFAGNGDFDAYAPRLARYHRGVGDDVVAVAVASLQELYEEVARRELRLAELGAKKVTRALAEQYPDLRPIQALFSECHEMFGHSLFGEQAADITVQTIRRARKTAITLLFDTQSSRKDAIPPKIVELVSVNVCFAVKSWRSNDGFLGDGSFQAGIRATELRPGRDRGTSLATGVSDEQFDIVKWHFVEVDDDAGFDAATEVIARAMAAVDARTQVKANAKAAAAPEDRDLLDDLAAVLAEATGPVPIADVPPLLRTLAPRWAPYKTLNGVGLRELLLDEYGIKVPSTGNRYPLDPAAVRQALARRQGAEGSE